MTLPAKVTMPSTGASGQIVAQVEMAPFDAEDTSQEPKLTVVNMSAKTLDFSGFVLFTISQDGMLAPQQFDVDSRVLPGGGYNCPQFVGTGTSASCSYLRTNLRPGSHLILEVPGFGVVAIFE
jgi:hypothetical protein